MFDEWASLYIHPEWGIIRSINEIPAMPGTPNIFKVTATSSDQYVLSGSKPSRNDGKKVGFGISANLTQACWSAVGETIERYAAGLFNPNDCIVTTGKSLASSAAPIDQFILRERKIAYKQYDFSLYHDEVVRRWNLGWSHKDGKSTWIPSQLLWFGYSHIDSRERIAQITSNGMGAGSRSYQSLCAGLLEIIERDAFMISWFLVDAKRKRLIKDTAFWNCLPSELGDLVDRDGLQFNVYSIQTDLGIPVMLTCIRNLYSHVVALGAAAALNASDALRKSCLEAYMIYSDQAVKSLTDDTVPCIDQIRRFGDHAAYYRNLARAEMVYNHFERSEDVFLLDLPSEISSGNYEAQWKMLSNILFQRGYDILTFDMTTPDISQVGFEVHKVFVPGLQPLLFGPVLPDDLRRLETYAERMNCTSLALNAFMHPFA